MTDKQHKILFVCMGNICRSPAAEAVFSHLIEQRDLREHFDIDSAATGDWHVGNPADPRSIEEGNNRGYAVTSKARQVNAEDFDHYDLLVCMDENNRENLLAMGAPAEKIRLLTDWHPDSAQRLVPDPYYGGKLGFVHMYELIEASSEALLEELVT